MADTKQKQIEIAERLQMKVLAYFETKLENNSLTDTGIATLVRLLCHNGWTLDPSRIAQGLRDKLTKQVDPSKFSEDDLDAVGSAVVGSIGV